MKYTVKKEMTLMDFLVVHYGKKNAKQYLKFKQVLVEGKVISQFDHMLAIGQSIVVTKESNDTALDILFEDKDIIVINKPSGLLSMSAGNSKDKTAYSMVGQYIKQKDAKAKVFIVHRLDRDTSGILMFAKSELVKHKLQDNWNEIVTRRGYLCVVEGKLDKDSGVIKNYLDESKTQQVYVTQKGGKLAITYYKQLHTCNKYSLVEVYLDTGRKNQIRVHMEFLGHSIVGDKKYGAISNPIRRLGLHCHDFAFTHPITNNLIELKLDAPDLFYQCVKKDNKK